MSTTEDRIEQHPDLLALRERYNRAPDGVVGQAVFGVTLLAALYAAVSPWIIGFRTSTPMTINDLVLGLAAAAVAAGIGTTLTRARNLTWTVPMIGIWLIIAQWVIVGVSATTPIVASNVAVGATLTAFGAAAAYLGMRAEQPEHR